MSRIDLTNAECEERPDGSRVVNLDVVARVTAPDGSLFYQKGKNYTLNAPRAAAGREARRGIDYGFEIEADAPGFYQLGVAVRDAVSGRAGNVTRFVEVADLARGDLSTSSLFLSPASDVASAAPPPPPGATISPPTCPGRSRRAGCCAISATSTTRRATKLAARPRCACG